MVHRLQAVGLEVRWWGLARVNQVESLAHGDEARVEER